jgi:RNA polymerase sigma factor (sigma-70 family)
VGYITKQFNIRLDKEEQLDLIRAWQEERDQEAGEILFFGYYDYIKNCVFRCRRRRAQLDDIFAEAFYRFFKCLDNYDPNRGANILTFLTQGWIHGPLMRHVLKHQVCFKTGLPFTSDQAVRVLRRNEATRRALFGDHCEWPVWPTEYNIDYPISKDEEYALKETLEDSSPDLSEVFSSISVLDTIESLLVELKDPRQEEIIRRRYLSGEPGETLQEIGNSFGLTRERVRQIEVVAIKKLRELLGGQ